MLLYKSSRCYSINYKSSQCFFIVQESMRQSTPLLKNDRQLSQSENDFGINLSLQCKIYQESDLQFQISSRTYIRTTFTLLTLTFSYSDLSKLLKSCSKCLLLLNFPPSVCQSLTRYIIVITQEAAGLKYRQKSCHAVLSA